MIITAKLLECRGSRLVLQADAPVEREALQKQAQWVEIRLVDGRRISAEQRRKIFAIIRDISLWCGHDPEYLRCLLTWDFRCGTDLPAFSLSDAEKTTARLFIDYLIGFCFDHSVPTKDTLLHQTDDIGRYLYMCLEHRRCAICNMPAEVHHVDRVGNGRNRDEIVHVGMRAIALCHEHHMAAHAAERDLFARHHIYGIKLDAYLCRRLDLKWR